MTLVPGADPDPEALDDEDEVEEEPKDPWDLIALVLVIAGVVLVAGGAFWVWKPAGVMVLGVGAIGLSFLFGYSRSNDASEAEVD